MGLTARGGGAARSRRSMLFYRDFRQFGGGHLKVWDYFQHVGCSRRYAPSIFFSEETLWDDSNPWRALRGAVLGEWRPERADSLFVAGVDWLMLPGRLRESSAAPIVNLVQGIGHASPDDPRFSFLRHKAIRICVSPEVKAALEETKRVNGPLYLIPDGIDLGIVPPGGGKRDIDVLVAGLKRPGLAAELEARLRRPGLGVVTAAALLPRPEFLGLLARARITVFLPTEAEGFYLPALEGMALGTLVICPDCIGNRSFCLNGYNCYRPQSTLEALLQSVGEALSLSAEEIDSMLANAQRTARGHDILEERKRFLDILGNIDQLW
ncbi:MAG: glycosyltransferase family 1 protein [Betaproteobacteria bacterium]|nr:glycosyltransferase family 1 protein [Betaproteobacteria bacterium]